MGFCVGKKLDGRKCLLFFFGRINRETLSHRAGASVTPPPPAFLSHFHSLITSAEYWVASTLGSV